MQNKKTTYQPYLIHFGLFTLSFVLILQLLTHVCSPVFIQTAQIQATHTRPQPTVIIDAGHGGEDCGAIGTNQSLEKNLNLEIAQKLNHLLRSNGIKTVMTREDDILLYDRNSDYQGQKKIQDLATRKRIAEQYKNAVFISIHMNAFPQSQYSGLQVYYSPHHTLSGELARAIQTQTKHILQPKNNRSVKVAGENIYLLDQLHCPAILIECGFLSNAEECARLCSHPYQQQLALIIGTSILQNLSAVSP